ncbi:MAG: ABC transporter substrate-binding protein [Acidimicrobiaceae bacterium]|nr:ABC transporter substrate-binding protein [Acidimicrobiaceae bacterium]
MGRWRALLALLAIFALISTGCGGDDSDDAVEPSTAAPAVEDTAEADDAATEAPAEEAVEEPDVQEDEPVAEPAPEPTPEPAPGGDLVVAMTSTDLPGVDTVWAFTQGGEGLRWVGLQLYDGLTQFDLSQGTEPAAVSGGLAESWSSDDVVNWTFNLREGVTFHDGTTWNAEAAVFNLDRFTNPESEYFTPDLAGLAGLFTQSIASYEAVDEYTLSITTNRPWSHLPEDLALLPMASPTAVQQLGNDGFAASPVGSGPFMFESLEPGARLVMAANPDYWRGAPQVARLIVRPIPDATARVAALRAGEVNWIEYASPDDVPGLRDDGFQIITNAYSQVWRGVFDTTKPPWDSPLVREAANLAIDRASIAEFLLSNTAEPAFQMAPRSDPGYDPDFAGYQQDLERARELLAEAGHPDGFSTTASVPTAGSGNMLPVPIAERVKSDLAQIGIDLEILTGEWGAMFGEYNSGQMPLGADMTMWASTFVLPGLWGIWFHSQSPANVGRFADPDLDGLLGQVDAATDPAERVELFRQINHQTSVGHPWLPVVNDLHPRALASNVQGFINPQSWFIDLTTVTVS